MQDKPNKPVEVTLAKNFGKSIVFQFHSKKSNSEDVVSDFLDYLKTKGVELKLSQRKASAQQLEDRKWLLTISVISEPSEVDGKKYMTFKDADSFYSLIKQEGSKRGRANSKQVIHLVNDPFSDSRADILYPKIRKIEQEFRIALLKHGVSIETSHLKNFRTGDHPLNMLDTYTLFNVYAQKPASDNYYLKKLAEATADKERVNARNLTVLDEMGFGNYRKSLAEISTIRNPVMHGRHISDEAFLKAYQDLTEIDRYIKSKQFMESVLNNPALLETLQETAKIAQRTIEALRPSILALTQVAQQQTSLIQQALASLAPIEPVAQKKIAEAMEKNEHNVREV